MAYELREGQGSLFKNDKQNDRQPDYRGTILIGGVTYRISAWEKTSRTGSNFISLQAEPQQDAPQGGQSAGYRRPAPSQPAAQTAFRPPVQSAPAPQQAPFPDYDSFPADDTAVEDLPF